MVSPAYGYEVRSRELPPTSGAVLSVDGVYRYRLDRDLGGLMREELMQGRVVRTQFVARMADINPLAACNHLHMNCPMRADGPVLAVIGVNPSTADAVLEDPTSRRVKGFAQALGMRRVIMGNKFARRATDVKELRTWDLERNVGPGNDEHLRSIMHQADVVVVAWGPLGKLPPHLRDRWRKVVRIAEDMGRHLYCWGTAKDGHPRHPLMLPADTMLDVWSRP